MMPVMDGKEATKLIKGLPGMGPNGRYGAMIVGVSALQEKNEVKEWMELGL
eukprot:CAMPEP_0170550356 /NCGR_PEP_ID=MMETSP0211-20121228/8420_1 /TAXON_ID=311385 /ORGANISM="Pseudokeronopsis sp., Strain OXSARD2" /LENGTH=50 /DNA_ID=CAMNT_0010856859 /DNA_START=88 /DNA_END=237 /DNA_ORIENTATION=-